MIWFYNLWVAVTAITAAASMIGALFFVGLRERLARYLALVFFSICADASHATITLGMSLSSQCRVQSVALIISRMLMRLFQCVAMLLVSLYFHGYLDRRSEGSRQ